MAEETLTDFLDYVAPTLRRARTVQISALVGRRDDEWHLLQGRILTHAVRQEPGVLGQVDLGDIVGSSVLVGRRALPKLLSALLSQ